MGLKNKLQDLYDELTSHDNEILVLAEESNNPALLEVVAYNLGYAAESIKNAINDAEHFQDLKKKSEEVLTHDKIDELAAFATDLDMSCDEELQSKAAVIDQLLLNMGVKKTFEQVEKSAQEEEIAKLREKYREKSLERPYNFPSEELDRDIKSAEAVKAIKDTIKEYRPMETALSTRYCPDHPGTSVMRVADDTYQCPLDKSIYNYREGFTTMKGNKVPGTDVQNQTQNLGDRNLEEMNFSTRESKLNQ